MVETTLRQLLEHPRKNLIVITVTVVIALLFLWPAVDTYFAVGAERSQLASDLQETEAKVAELGPLMEQLADREKKLAEFEKEAMSRKNVEELRDELSEVIRKSGCQIRRNSPQPEATRQHEFNPEESTKSSGDKKGPRYVVVGRSHSLTITGPQAGVLEVMNRVQARKGLVQIQSFSMKQASDSSDSTTMDLVLLLLDLVKPKANGA